MVQVDSEDERSWLCVSSLKRTGPIQSQSQLRSRGTPHLPAPSRFWRKRSRLRHVVSPFETWTQEKRDVLGAAKPPSGLNNVLVVSCCSEGTTSPIISGLGRSQQSRLKHPFSEPLDLDRDLTISSPAEQIRSLTGRITIACPLLVTSDRPPGHTYLQLSRRVVYFITRSSHSLDCKRCPMMLPHAPTSLRTSLDCRM